MSDAGIIFLTIGGGFFAVAVIVTSVVAWMRKRGRAVEAIGAALGCRYTYKADRRFVKQLPDLPLFNPRRIRHVYHVLAPVEGQSEPWIFDFSYVVPMGKSAVIQTVALFRKSGLDLPTFVLRPRGFAAKIGEVFGNKPIEFPGNPTFMENYDLNGNDEAAIRRVFTARLLGLFAESPKLSMEAAGDAAVLYRFARRQKIEDFEAFVTTARAMCSELSRGS
jgi:hypothetical protein